MSFNRWPTACLLAALLVLAGCGRNDDDTDTGTAPTAPTAPASGDALSPSPSSLDATWQGVLPCADCDGIQTRLRLVADAQGRRYELQETYLADAGSEVFEAQGTWTEETATLDGQPTVVYQLDTGGASRWFALQPDGALEMLDARESPMADGLAHRLQRM